MPGVFVSHAGADREFVDDFIDKIIRLGCEVPKADILYTSQNDTGIPAGGNLNEYIKQKVADAAIVIAILTPNFQASSYCIAELGAAWSRTGQLFPIAAPGLEHTDLQGVLSGLIVRNIDNSEALDELHQAACSAAGTNPGAVTWNIYKVKWLSSVKDLATRLGNPRIISPADYDRAQADAEGARAALSQQQSEIAELRAQIEELKAVKDADEVRRILKPRSETSEYENLVKVAKNAFKGVPSPVRDAIFYDLKNEEMPWPSAYDDKWAFDQAESARVEGWLKSGSADDTLVPDFEFGKVDKAAQAVNALQRFLSSGDRTEEFCAWFRMEHEEVPLDLRNKILWDQIL